MKLSHIIAGAVLCASTAQAIAVEPVIPRDETIERRVAQELKRLTLEEKIGQMTQLTLGVLSGPYDPATRSDLTIPKADLDKIIGQYKVGSILNVADIALTPEHWYEIVSQIQDYSMKTLKVPCVYGLDMNHGASYTLGATLFPQNINMGATFNRELAHRGGEITAYETRASDVPWTFNPLSLIHI